MAAPDASNAPQRIYRALCPNCGAPVDFFSAQSTHAVCGFCQSTVVRSGEQLERIGKMAELFEDFSPLQLQASGVYQGRRFSLIGRLQYQYEGGVWTEWIAGFGEGAAPDASAAASAPLGYLSEDNGAFVFSLPLQTAQKIPPADQFRIGASTQLAGKRYTVASSQTVSLRSAQGELPHLPALGAPFAMVELRSAEGDVLTVDFGPLAVAGGALAAAPAAPAASGISAGAVQPTLSLGRSVTLGDLQLTGLKDESAKDDKSTQAFACPQCGAPVKPLLATSQSIVCAACNSVMDLTGGVGGAVHSAVQQTEAVKPLIAIGSRATLQGVAWQVVGYQRRSGREGDGGGGDADDEEDEAFEWDEYLLYNQKRGFVFLVDASDGWSLVQPATGAPEVTGLGQSARHLGSNYALTSRYQAETLFVSGEFYWKVEKGQRSKNADYASGRSVLSREETAKEVTWSSGSRLDSSTVVAAFKRDASQADLFKRADAAPLSANASSLGFGAIVVVFIVIVLFLLLLSQCSPSSSGSSGGYRTSGGSYGGSSGGGGHK